MEEIGNYTEKAVHSMYGYCRAYNTFKVAIKRLHYVVYKFQNAELILSEKETTEMSSHTICKARNFSPYLCMVHSYDEVQ